LYYCTTIITGIIFIEKILLANKHFSNTTVYGSILLFMPFNICLTGAVNWAWSRSFNEVNWFNRGYYNHKMQYKTFVNNAGCVEIYDILAEDAGNRVLAYGEHPHIERFPCMIDSELDVTYWGNNALMSNVDSYMNYIEYVGYEYVLIWKDYVQDGSMADNNISALFENGKVTDLMVENGHMLLTLGQNDKTNCMNMKEQYDEEIVGKIGDTFATCVKEYGIYEDGWLAAEAKLEIRSGEKGIIKLEGMYNGPLTGDEYIRIIYNDKELQYSITSGNISIEIPVLSNSVIQMEIFTNLQTIPAPPDIRELTFHLNSIIGF